MIVWGRSHKKGMWFVEFSFYISMFRNSLLLKINHFNIMPASLRIKLYIYFKENLKFKYEVEFIISGFPISLE